MYPIIEGLKNIGRAKLASFLVSFLIGLALVIGFGFFTLTMQLRESSGYLEKSLEIEVFLIDGLEQKALDSLQTRLESLPEIRSAFYISKDSAAAVFRAEVGEDITELTGGNPLPASFRLVPDLEILITGNVDSLTSLLESFPGIDDVAARREYLLSLMKYREPFRLIHLAVLAAFLVTAHFVIVNIIRLSIHSRRESIEIMKLIGATNRFICAPFIVEGTFVGLLGGLAGSGFTWGISFWLEYMLKISFIPGQATFLYLTAAGCMAGIVGSLISVVRYVRRV